MAFGTLGTLIPSFDDDDDSQRFLKEPFICNIYIHGRLAPRILITYLLENVCFKACFENSQGHLYCEEWQVGSSRGVEQLTRKHGHHMSSGVSLGHGDSFIDSKQLVSIGRMQDMDKGGGGRGI